MSAAARWSGQQGGGDAEAPEDSAPGKPHKCCKATMAKCTACSKGQTIEEYCHDRPEALGCGEHVDEEEDEGADATDGQLSLKPRCKGKSARHGCAPVEATPGPPICCDAMTASCLACSRGQTVEEYCKDNADTAGCDMPAPVEATPGPRYCCKAMTASCLACSRGQTVEEYCHDRPKARGCAKRDEEDEGAGARMDATPGPRYCCKAMTASCLACSRGQTVAVYCRDHPDTAGCDRKEGRGKGSGRGRKAKAAKETWGRRR
mmetsp:Transcript_29108/g.84285  ORF Transcript_29108/g.84285 Transcript_29108/m.84285 type:complete len:262 (-) Transcript_29108:111-896(-)